MKRTFVLLSLGAVMLSAGALELEAQRRGGGMRGGGMRGGGMRGGGMSRSMARPSVSRPASRPSFDRGARPDVGRSQIGDRAQIADRDRRIDNNRNITNIDRDRITNINRPVNIGDIDGDWDGRWDGCCYRPLAGAAVGAAVGYAAGVATSYPIGTVVYTLPSECVVTVVNDVTYEQCGSTWYQPQFSGTDTTYIVVDPPGSPSPSPSGPRIRLE